MKTIYFHPLFDEQKSSYRFSYCLSQAFSDKGIALERPDYRGAGESDQPFCSVTLDSLQRDVESYISKTRCCLIGLRFGANLILDYALRCSQMDHRLILIEPIIDGKEYIGYIFRKQRLKDHLTNLPNNYMFEEQYVNIEGYKTNTELIRRIQEYAFPAIGYPDMRIISTQKKIGQPFYATVNYIDFPDFWERIPIIDYSPLIQKVMDCYGA